MTLTLIIMATALLLRITYGKNYLWIVKADLRQLAHTLIIMAMAMATALLLRDC